MIVYASKVPCIVCQLPLFPVQEIDPSVLDKDEIEAKELQPEGTAVVSPF